MSGKVWGSMVKPILMGCVIALATVVAGCAGNGASEPSGVKDGPTSVVDVT